MKTNWLRVVGQCTMVIAAAVAACAITAAPARADGLTVSLSPLSDVAAGSTGNGFDVLLTNGSGTAVSIEGFFFEVLASSADVTFTGASTGTTAPYIFGADSLFGPDITAFGSGSGDLGASDLDAVDQISLTAGSTVGLGHVLFNVSPTAPTETVSFDLAGFPGTSLSDDLGNNVPIENFTGGKFTIKGAVAGVPEPATLVLLLAIMPLALFRRIVRG
jgi:hypothetical protein